ncbi:metalloregulator ArsR/SmtB family transcription factor [Inquilinus sp. CAU 1745]|uniref:helix-turn-helix transcriptional regulator n=1 Tax=Inquilinus sp. CAU 1745 TaxID=3140369 RepID=UPI00325AA0FE
MSRTIPADRILFLLKSKGPRNAAALAGELGVTSEAARQQLVKLKAEGLVDHREIAAGIGRPARLWALTDAANARFPDTHAELAVQLLGGVRDLFGAEGLDRLIAERERANLAAYSRETASAESLEEKVRALAAIRSREGYMADWRAEGDGFLLVENHCPICAAAAACQGFCRSELALFRATLGPDATVERTDHILAGARRCAYRITPAAG